MASRQIEAFEARMEKTAILQAKLRGEVIKDTREEQLLKPLYAGTGTVGQASRRASRGGPIDLKDEYYIRRDRKLT